VASAVALLGATGAQASTITVGSVLPAPFTSKPLPTVGTYFNTALPERGANLVSPVSGAIVRWQVQGAKGGPFYLRVLHPNGSGGYAAHGTSGPATPSGTGLQTFTANIPVEAGDLIGVDPTDGSDEIGFAAVAGAGYASIFPTLVEGGTRAPSGGEQGQEIELSAEVQPTPTIASISPGAGSIAGGTVVTISGHDFASASAVKFGSTPASTFTVDSETQITATAPPSTEVGPVDITTTPLAGTSAVTRADSFGYEGCVVPKLKGKSLKTSRRVLRNAGCKLGKVTGKQGKNAKVVKQSPRPRQVLVPDTKVSVTVAAKAPHHTAD
jgi:hypothetical protein